jgi:hypothetical protein
VTNMVELLADPEDCAFDQPCRFGHRVETHAVYCHADHWQDAPRKCRRNRTDYLHEDCPGFRPNPLSLEPLSPSPLVGTLCYRCAGQKVVAADRGKVETCERCCGDGIEPHAVALSPYQLTTLEMGLGHTYRPGNHRPFMRIAETREQNEEISVMQEINLIDTRSIQFFKGATVLLLELTGKGEAVMHAIWAANPERS